MVQVSASTWPPARTLEAQPRSSLLSCQLLRIVRDSACVRPTRRLFGRTSRDTLRLSDINRLVVVAVGFHRRDTRVRAFCRITDLCIANGTIKEPRHARIGQLNFPFDMQRSIGYVALRRPGYDATLRRSGASSVRNTRACKAGGCATLWEVGAAARCVPCHRSRLAGGNRREDFMDLSADTGVAAVRRRIVQPPAYPASRPRGRRAR